MNKENAICFQQDKRWVLGGLIIPNPSEIWSNDVSEKLIERDYYKKKIKGERLLCTRVMKDGRTARFVPGDGSKTHLLRSEEVVHLPGCTDWDWVEPKPEPERWKDAVRTPDGRFIVAQELRKDDADPDEAIFVREEIVEAIETFRMNDSVPAIEWCRQLARRLGAYV